MVLNPICRLPQVVKINNVISSSTYGQHGAIGDFGTALYCGCCLYTGALLIVLIVLLNG